MKRPVKYLQTDPKWANNDYSAGGDKSTIKNAGCGPTSAAMVIATWKNSTVTPAVTAAWSKSHGYKAPNQGTYYTYFTPQMAAYGITCKQLNFSNLRNMTAANAKVYHDKALNAIKNGDLVIACMGPGLWTSSGHFILWYGYENGKVYINDPYSTASNKECSALSTLQSQVKYYFICEHPVVNTPEGDDEDMTQEKFNEFMEGYRKTLQDNDSAKYSTEARNWAIAEKIISGSTTKDKNGNTNYMWEDMMTREQFVTMLYRFAKLIGKV